MLSLEDNEMLARTGRGTPMGELFRRFWLPALLSSDLPGPDSAPRRLRVAVAPAKDAASAHQIELRVTHFNATGLIDMGDPGHQHRTAEAA